MKVLAAIAGPISAKEKADYIVNIAKRLGAELIVLHVMKRENQGRKGEEALNYFYEAGKKAVLSPERALPEESPLHPNLVLLFGRKGIGAKARMLIGKFFPSRETITALYPVSRGSLRLPFFYMKWMAALFRGNADSAWRLFRERGKRRGPEPGSGADLAPLMSWLLSR